MKMSKILAGLLAMALLLAPAVPIVKAQQPGSGPLPGVTYWWFQLRDERNQPISAPGICFVYTAGSDTLATIYTDQTLATAAANPVTAAPLFQSSGNSCAFYTPSTTTSVDVIAWTKRGRSRLSSYTPGGSAVHLVVIDQQMTQKIIQIPYSVQAPSSGISYVNSGVTIPKGFVVTDVYVQVTNAGSGNNIHLSAGILEKHAGGFIALGSVQPADNSFGGMNVTTLGWSAVLPQLTTTGLQATQPYCISGFHVGALLATGTTPGTCATSTHSGTYLKTPFVGNGTAKTVVYHVGSGTTPGTFQLSPAQATAAGYFYLVGQEIGNDF